MDIEDGWLQVPTAQGWESSSTKRPRLEHSYEPLDLYDLHQPEMQLKMPRYSGALR